MGEVEARNGLVLLFLLPAAVAVVAVAVAFAVAVAAIAVAVAVVAIVVLGIGAVEEDGHVVVLLLVVALLQFGEHGAFQETGTDDEEGDIESKIGRASCRERV